MSTTTLRLYGLVLAMAAITITGCSSGGGDDADNGNSVSVEQPLQQTVEKYAVAGILTDPSGAPISGIVTLSATDKTGAAVKLYSDKTGGTQLTTLSVSSVGLISFFVADTAALPVTVKAVADAPGRVSSSTILIINKAGISSSFSIKLVDTNSTTTAGVVSAVSQATASSTTGLDSALTTSVSNTDITKTSAEVKIPASTKLTDSSGAALSGTITATITTFAPPTSSSQITESTVTNELALENFPGGLGNAMIASASPQTPASEGVFATAGFIAVNVTDSNGKKATNSDVPFVIRMDIPAGTINPNTGSALVADGTTTIPIWTYNETAAVWKAEIDAAGNQVMGLIKADAKGLYVEYTTNHFSYWNLDWHYSAVCTGTIILQNDAQKLPLTLKTTFSDGSGYVNTGYKPSGDGSVTVANVAKDRLFDIFLIDSSNKVITSLKNFNWCARPNKSITFDYVAPSAKPPVLVTVNVSEYCTQDPTVTRSVPSALTTVVGQRGSSFFTSGKTGTDGSYVYNLMPGAYYFNAYDRTTGTYATKSKEISAAQTIDFQSPVTCNTLSTTGATGSSGNVNFKQQLKSMFSK